MSYTINKIGVTQPQPQLEMGGQPYIVGTGKVGSVLTANNGQWHGSPAVTHAYAWAVAGTAVANATSQYYTVATANSAKTVSVAVTGTNATGGAQTWTAMKAITLP